MADATPNEPQPSSTSGLKPGDSISPGETAMSTPQPELPAPQGSSEPVTNLAPSLQLPEQPEIPGSTTPWIEDAVATTDENGTITWTASEFLAHQKSAGWYLAIGLVALAVATIVYLLTRDVISAAVIVIAGVALAVYGARQPRELQYALSNSGLLIANKFYPFHEFRSFAVLEEGPLTSIIFMPLKRFGQLITIYIDPADENKILDVLSTHLPLEKRDRDMIDRFMQRIRF